MNNKLIKILENAICLLERNLKRLENCTAWSEFNEVLLPKDWDDLRASEQGGTESFESFKQRAVQLRLAGIGEAKIELERLNKNKN